MKITIHRYSVLPILPLFCLLALSVFSAPKEEVSQFKVGETVEITRSHSWCWFPSIHRFRSGEFMVGMVLSPDQLHAESTNSGYCISKDGGKTWGPRHTIGQGANHDGAWLEAPDETDSIWQFGAYPDPLTEGDTKNFTAVLTKFTRGGRASSQDRDIVIRFKEPMYMIARGLHAYNYDWNNPVPDTKFTHQIAGRPWGNIVKGTNGELYCSAYFETAKDYQLHEEEVAKVGKKAAKRYRRTVVLRSTDGGKSWLEHGLIAAPPIGERPSWMGTEGFSECTLSLLPDGRLYAAYRSGGMDGEIGNSWSSDGGKTWTDPTSMGFKGVAPRLRRLSNGALVLATGRPGPVQLRINADGKGERWSEPVTIYTGQSSRYCDVAEIEPGKLLVVYDNIPYGWHEIPYSHRDARNKILGTFVEYKP